ncbi:hypothetical protein MUP32_03065 [Candidatus Microgenomates bacterium]|nr:hypothetical protein [Candidatus Microgenomates bacterium]
MAKTKNNLDPEILLPKISNWKNKVKEFLKTRKKLAIGLLVIILIIAAVGYNQNRRATTNVIKSKSIVSEVDKSFDFAALNNQGKAAFNNKIKLKIASAEKTSQVLVKDQVYTAKNNKLFLIVNLELKNDATVAYNILPGDLVRLSYNGDEDNKYAPDLHNNLVNVAAISTKTDRIGFVIPDDAKDYKLIVGELEGKKETIQVNFPS